MTTNAGTAISDVNVKRAGARRGTTEDAPTTPLATRPAAKPRKAAKSLSKASAVIRLLSRSKGATGPEIESATEWQPHSVRAYLSGLRKKGHSLVREARKDGEQSYRLNTAAIMINTSPAASGGNPQDEGSGKTPAEGLSLGADKIDFPSGNATIAATA